MLNQYLTNTYQYLINTYQSLPIINPYLEILNQYLKCLNVGLSPSKKNCFICFNKSPIKMMKNAFYFILKALFILEMFKIFVLTF